MDDMNIGQCLDYIQEYIEDNTDDNDKIRKANQNDFDAF